MIAQHRSHSLQGASSLGLLQCRYPAQLLHQAHHVEQTPELHDLAAADPVEDATWHLNTLASGRDALQFTSVRAPTGPPLGHLPLPRSAPQRWNASRKMTRGTYQRNSLTHLDRPPLLWACGSRRRSPLTRPQQSRSPHSRTPLRSGAPVPCSLPPTSRYLLCVRLNLVIWTVRQTMRECNPTFVGVFGTVCGLTTQVAENRELLGGWGIIPALFVCLPVL